MASLSLVNIFTGWRGGDYWADMATLYRTWHQLALTTKKTAATGVLSKNPLRKIGGRLDVTFPGEVCQVAETQTTYLTPFS